MTRKLLVTCLIAAAALGITASSGSASPTATISGSCGTGGNYPPASYVTSITEHGTSCSKARKLIKAYHACRKENGGRNGRCSGVTGYKCREGDRQSVPHVQYNAKVVCTKGNNTIKSTYTQNL